jgi:CheY-like chemotaxis protein
MGEGKRVLVVDDEDDVRALVRRQLEKGGYTVETAASGQEALDAVAARRPDLVVLDLGMPDMDGWTVIERLKPAGAPPIVLLATQGDNPKDGPFRECIVAYLFKPLLPDELAAVCRRILSARPKAAAFSPPRQEPRRRLIVKVVLVSRDGNPVLVGRLIDLSSTGLQMEIDGLLERGDEVRVELHVPGPEPRLEVTGSVLWRNEAGQGYAYGIDLSRMSGDAVRRLQVALSPS